MDLVKCRKWIRLNWRVPALILLLTSGHQQGTAQTAPKILTTVAGPVLPGANRHQRLGAGALALSRTGDVYFTDGDRVGKWAARTGIFTSVAGTGDEGYSGDGGPATSATLKGPASLALDAEGNLYIADRGNRVIRKVAAGTGTITTVAGQFAGAGQPLLTRTRRNAIRDGGQATEEYLWEPDSVASDAAGNLYIADGATRLIRKITAATGVITSFARIVLSGEHRDQSFTPGRLVGDSRVPIALDAAGNLYYSVPGYIRKLAAGSSFRLAAQPGGGIVYNPGEVYAGNGEEGYSGDGGPANRARVTARNPGSLALDMAGNLYIAGNNRIRMIAAGTGIITTVAGNGNRAGPKYDGEDPPWHDGDGGSATSATISPLCVAPDRSGNLYLCGGDNTILRVAPTTISSGTAPVSGGLTSPVPKTLPAAMPAVLYECDIYERENDCGTWNWKGDHYEGRWRYGALAQLTVRRFDAGGVFIERDGERKGVYRGKWEGDHIAEGDFESVSGGGSFIPWRASSSPLPGTGPVSRAPFPVLRTPAAVSIVPSPRQETAAVPAQSVPAVKMPPVIRECDELMKVAKCGTWTWNKKEDHYDARWPDGSTGVITVSATDPAGFVRVDVAGPTLGVFAMYMGVIIYDCYPVSPCNDGHIVNGQVGWTWRSKGLSGQSAWRASFGRTPSPADSEGFGVNGEIFDPGPGVSVPSRVSSIDPEYSVQARAARLKGAVALTAVIDTEGHPRDLTVVTGLGMGLDEQALAAVLQWRFTPGMKDGRPVNVRVKLSVSFKP
jgi:TonB family protein